uniref:RHD domain-containing protein n=1 Tax=Macrostomum lignano TaxID=282301 RepID=A0A1I8F3S4_9PLAT
QLMSITIPSLRGSALPEGSATADRIECSIRIVDLKSDVAAEHEFYLSRSCTLCNSLTGVNLSMTSLSIEILEQPTRYHRFRYEKEVSGGKLGGLLYGRSEKSCVRVRVSNIDPLMQKSVTVIGGTVSPDLYPHPFFMVGDDCRSGTFQLKKDTDSLGGKTEFEISLEKVSLVCVLLRPPDKLQEAVNRRLAINFNPFNKDLTSMSSMYTARNLKPLRLAFQIFVTDYNDVTAPTSAAVYSEEIYDYSKVTVPEIPTPLRALALELWRHLSDFPRLNHSILAIP